MANELMRPIDAETANAIAEAARTGGKAIDAGRDLGAYADRVLGRLPQNLVGLVIGDWVEQIRIRRWSEMYEKTRAILQKRNVREPFAEVSPSIAIPLIEAAVDETRDELKSLWHRLLANALDPNFRGSVSKRFIDTLKLFDPLDALIMDKLTNGANIIGDMIVIDTLGNDVKATADAYFVALRHLKELGCVAGFFNHTGQEHSIPDTANRIRLSSYGRELMRACKE